MFTDLLVEKITDICEDPVIFQTFSIQVLRIANEVLLKSLITAVTFFGTLADADVCDVSVCQDGYFHYRIFDFLVVLTSKIKESVRI